MSNQDTNKAPTNELHEKPLVTFALFAYNQEKYIREAIEGAFSQTYSPLEIILTDDCSTDGTFDIIQAMAETYSGPHKIKTNRNPRNLGLIDHVNKIFEISTGELIVAAAGDDISLPERVSFLTQAYTQSNRKAQLIHSSVIKIDNSGCELGLRIPPIVEHPLKTEELAVCLSLYIGATGAWSRSIYYNYRPLAFKDAYEDLVLGFRAAISDSLLYVDKPLVRYRSNIGISGEPNYSKFALATKITFRRKKLKVVLDTYEQRLSDLGQIKIKYNTPPLESTLYRAIELQKMRLLFYNNFFLLTSRVFTKDYLIVIRSLGSELKYLLGLIKRIFK